jgi:hypothetical protein
MPIAGITMVTVTNTYVKSDGSPASGTVTFTPAIRGTTDNITLPQIPLNVKLDEDGEISVSLAATDDADWSATDFTYTVTEQIDGAPKRSFSIEVPAATVGDLDLATVSPVENPTIPPAYATIESATAIFTNPTGSDTAEVQIPKNAVVTAVKGKRYGGTGATINAQVGSSDLLSSDLSLASTGSWVTGSGLQNTSVGTNATVTLELAGVTGTPSKVYVQVNFSAVV